MATDKPKIIFVIDQDLLTRLDNFRYDNHIPSRGEAIRQLIEAGLQVFQKKPPKKQR